MKLTVAQYLEQRIAMSPKSQKEIAEEIRYSKPNMITMIKQGKTRLPLNKVGLLASALETDPVHLLRLVLEEYEPETLQIIEAIFGRTLLTDQESKLINAVRATLSGLDLTLDERLQRAIVGAIEPFSNKEHEARQAAAESLRRRASVDI